jgi:DNA polymerase
MSEMNSLEEVASQVRNCHDCPLSQGRTNAVPGEGPSDARIMFIGEGPGHHEDRLGRPFVGAAGSFLEELLASIGLKRQDVFIANMIKCRPPNNRDPLPAEVAECGKYLDRQIELLAPELVVTLGRFSMAKFIQNETISRARGKLRKISGLNVYPVMHPAAALHRQELRKTIESDFLAIPGLLEREDAEPIQEETETEPEQLSLF